LKRRELNKMTETLKASVIAIDRAADVLRRGGLVAFPTETVYGLGANALDAAAVARVFAAKGRPANNPIIVHVANAALIDRVADVTGLTPPRSEWLAKLAERFWPGPLTLVLPKHPQVPGNVTAGGPTVAVRVPAHPVARALLQAVQLPIAAPSANRSSELSPTTAEHVRQALDGRIDMILDAGPCPGGIESTVLDITTDPPRLLRPGLVTVEQIESVIGPIARFAPAGEIQETDASRSVLRSPGMLPRHYSPRTPLEVAGDDGRTRVAELASSGQRVGWLTWPEAPPAGEAARETLPCEPAAYAAGLYAALHTLDAMHWDRIVVSRPPDDDAWLAIRDRLRRASGDARE
jgi:L-threonylcarbamoyladenylate synthase